MKIQEQLTWTDLPEALRASIEFDTASEVLRNLTTLDALDGDVDDDPIDNAVYDDHPTHEFTHEETVMWF